MSLVAIVVTRAAHMPSSCHGKYRKVYVVALDPRNKSLTILWDSGPCNVGKSPRCAYQKALVEAKAIASEYNANGAV